MSCRPRQARDHDLKDAGTFAVDQLVGAHVTLGREHLSRSGGLVRAILVNSGNANCATGAEGVISVSSNVLPRAVSEVTTLTTPPPLRGYSAA